MESNRKRPKVMVRLENKKCIIVNRMNDENAPVALPAVNKLTLHPSLLQNLQQNQQTEHHRTKDVATQTEYSECEPENGALQTILHKLNSVETWRQTILHKLNSMESNHRTQMAETNEEIRLLGAQIELLSDRIMSRPGLVTETNFGWEPTGTKEELEP